MTKIYYHSNSGRVVTSFLLILFVLGLWMLPSPAGATCDVVCNSELAFVNHQMPEDMDSSQCETPDADFCACPREGCDSLLVWFTDYSQGYIDTWEWDFGDPASGSDNFSGEESPIHIYRTPGFYTVTLTVHGCGGTDQVKKVKHIVVETSSKADFVATTEVGCEPMKVQFEDRSYDPDEWLWDFGDGTTSTERNPAHLYAAVGVYTVSLTVSNECGSDTKVREQYITVLEGPTADFTADKTETCVGATVTFTDLSMLASTWYWDFGDGTESILQNPTHIYTAPGLYTVTLIIEGECGKAREIKTEYIRVIELPVADFTADPTQLCVGGTVNFTDLSTDAASWYWEFGDVSTSTDQNPLHSYTVAGVYTVSLRVINICGEDTATREEYIRVINTPTADFHASSTESCVDKTISFYDDSQNADEWQWDFGDGTTSIVQNPSHIYTAPGRYTVSLTVSNVCGEDTKIREYYINVYEPPTAGFEYDLTEGCEAGTITVIDQSTNALSWYWEFGDGATSGDRHPSPHQYATAGDYTVTLTVSNPCGEDDESKTVTVTIGRKPVAAFEADVRQSCTGAEIRFTDLSTDAETWSWNFGDGETSDDPNPTHTYSDPGVYDIKLSVTNPCGESAMTRYKYVTVSAPPVANFTSDINQGCVGAVVIFTDQSLYADSWNWDFGDGSSSPAQSPTHTYTVAGVYDVTLTVTNQCGDDSETKSEYVVIYPGPTADFDASLRSGNVALSVDFTDLSTSTLGITSWSWTFGDGGVSSAQHPTHVYTAAGVYTVTLTVEDECGTDEASKKEYITVTDSCSVDFSAEPTEGCAELTVYFAGTTTGPCEIISWTWDFGDPTSGNDNTASGQNVQHVYASSGIYTVTLTAEDVSGTKTVTKTDYITVRQTPTASFSATPTEGIAPLLVSFADSSDAGGGTLTRVWNFDDPASGSDNEAVLENPSHSYETAGVYTVSLIVTNECGADTAYTDITVSPAITITKDVDKPVAPMGAELLYSLIIYNNSDEVISNILVVDTIPDSTSYVDGSATGGGVHNSGENLVFWLVRSVHPGTHVQLDFRVLIDGQFEQLPALVSNYAIATIGTEVAASQGPRTFVSNVVETIVDAVTGELDITKSVSATLASPTDLLTYTLTIDNANPVTAANVMVYDAIPEFTTYVAGSISASGTYTPDDSLHWTLGTMAPFESRTVSFQVTVNAGVPDGLKIPNTALVRSSLGGTQSNEVVTAVSLTPIVVTKTTGRPSGMVGDLIRFTITIDNYSDEAFTDVHLIDTMPGGMFFVPGTSLLDGARVADPAGDNPYDWTLGDLPASGSMTVTYTGLIGASAYPGMNENVARSYAIQGGTTIHSNRAIAQIYVLSQTLTGSIRGKVVVDCDGDGVADMEPGPYGMDVYLDDGSQSRVNKQGMFYFSTVRPGERVVALDERDLDGYYVPEGAQASVFVHVHETGESYVIFRICPDYPHLDITKEASIVPTVKVVKTARLDPEQTIDSLGVQVDYQIDIRSNGLADPTKVRVVDSLPAGTRVLLDEKQPLKAKQNGDQLVYELTAAHERIEKSVYYSLRDLELGARRYLTNKVHVEGDVARDGSEVFTSLSDPAIVAAGPFRLAPPQDVQVTLTPALFITSLADLQAPAIPQLQAVADSIEKYADATVRVEGHTDYRPIHTEQFPSNWELGEARAKAVVDWLVDNRHIDRDRMAYESFAATRPVVTTGRTSEQLQPNRRTEVIIEAHLAGFIDPANLPADGWRKSTSLRLTPAKFDTLFEQPPVIPIEADLDDSWEVVLTVENTSAIAADNAALTDVLPDGVAYVNGSATIDGKVVTATVAGSTLKVTLVRVDPSQTVTLRYRVSAIAGATPSGGGAASVEVRTATDLPVIQKSNVVRFK